MGRRKLLPALVHGYARLATNRSHDPCHPVSSQSLAPIFLGLQFENPARSFVLGSFDEQFGKRVPGSEGAWQIADLPSQEQVGFCIDQSFMRRNRNSSQSRCAMIFFGPRAAWEVSHLMSPNLRTYTLPRRLLKPTPQRPG
jgi:hypothetical protein